MSIAKLFSSALLLLSIMAFNAPAMANCPGYQDHEFRKLHSQKTINLCDVTRDKVVLFVNTASHCGYTRQYKGLEGINQRYKDHDFVVVGFASNDFNQESKDEKESADICYVNHGVTFNVFAATSVKGKQANPVFTELAAQSQAPNWNFNKYLVGKNGKVIKHFASSVTPDSEELERAIAGALGN